MIVCYCLEFNHRYSRAVQQTEDTYKRARSCLRHNLDRGKIPYTT
jgi:hypothetical protein